MDEGELRGLSKGLSKGLWFGVTEETEDGVESKVVVLLSEAEPVGSAVVAIGRN